MAELWSVSGRAPNMAAPVLCFFSSVCHLLKRPLFVRACWLKPISGASCTIGTLHPDASSASGGHRPSQAAQTRSNCVQIPCFVQWTRGHQPRNIRQEEKTQKRARRRIVRHVHCTREMHQKTRKDAQGQRRQVLHSVPTCRPSASRKPLPARHTSRGDLTQNLLVVWRRTHVVRTLLCLSGHKQGNQV